MASAVTAVTAETAETTETTVTALKGLTRDGIWASIQENNAEITWNAERYAKYLHVNLGWDMNM
tara:strand:+ start:49498 stop:49689 length:192 start_codon:yes stop_codon:yes gene_type:complete